MSSLQTTKIRVLSGRNPRLGRDCDERPPPSTESQYQEKDRAENGDVRRIYYGEHICT